MAEYSNLSATINAQIRANGVQAITGPVLNAVLAAMVNVLGDGYRLAGVAHPADNPGSPDNRVAYLATQDGTYTNFGGLAVSGEVALLLWDSAWTKAPLFSIDTAVTPGSGNLVTSGAVDDALTTLAGNIAAAYMQLVPGATTGNLAEFGNAGQVRDAGLATSDLATKDGHYPDLFAGFAGNLVDTRSAGTRQGPFAFRQSGGDGVNYMRKILGRTEAWNQLVDPSQGSHPEATISSGLITVNATVPAGQNRFEIFGSISALAGHKYLLSQVVVSGDMTSTITYFAGSVNSITGTGSRIIDVAGGVTSAVSIMLQNYAGSDAKTFSFSCYILLVDLTLEGLGLTTADQFRALHPLLYYNYNAGVLKNNAATGLETVGFNQWDEVAEIGNIDGSTGENIPNANTIRSKNYIQVIPEENYFFRFSAGTPSTTLLVRYYDANKGYLGALDYNMAANGANEIRKMPSGCHYIRIACTVAYGTTYNHDICINRSDASRNGIYEPYWKRDIVLGLNNLACHDENNNAVVVNGLDGVGTSQDELIVENGWGTKIIKRRGRRAYQAGDESDATLMTDGTNTDYPLATPKVLTLDNPIPALIEVDSLGTERRLPEDTADNPQAPFECDSNYSVSTANLVRLLNL